jgi:hypothetical protein
MSDINFPDTPSNDNGFEVWKWSSDRNAWKWNVSPKYYIEYLVIAGGGAGGNAGTAGGGGGGGQTSGIAGNGGFGVVIIKYPDFIKPISSVDPGLTYDEPIVSGYRVYRFTAGTGTVTV